MIIRQLEASDFERQTELSEFAFQYKTSPEELEARRQSFRPEESWGAFDEQDRLLSKMILLPLECWVGGKPLKMGGVAGVATWPEARRSNCVAKLLTHSLEHMKGQGQTISMLHPFSIPFYRKFGWEFTVEQKKYELDMSQLPKRKDSPGRMETIPKKGELLNELYEAFASAYNGALKRSPDWWANRVLSKPGRVSVWTNESGSTEAYVLYEVKEGVLTVFDWAALNEEARNALWAFLANHDSMAKTIRISVPADDALPFLLPDPRCVKQETHPYFMSRVVDAEGLIGQYAFNESEARDELTLRVSDEYAPWNDRTFRIAFEKDGTAGIAATEDDAEASCHIRTLTAMLLGGRRPEWLLRGGQLSGSREAARKLERRIPVITPYLPDFF